MPRPGYKKIKTSVDEFIFVMRNLDSWERMTNLKFVEADLEGGNVTLMVNPVASTGFYYWVDKSTEKETSTSVAKGTVKGIRRGVKRKREIDNDSESEKVRPKEEIAEKEEQKTRLMAELIRDTRVGYIELEDFADFDEELLNELKNRLINVENPPDCERCFPKTEESLSLFHKLMRTARWKRV